MTSFTDVFNAGLWDAPAGSWDTLLRSLCAEGSVVRLTETTTHHPAPLKGWHAVRFSKPGAYECSTYFDTAVWELVTATAEQIATVRYALGGKGLKPALHALGVVLRHRKTGRSVLFVSVHWPSAIETIVERDKSGKGSKFPRIVALFQGFSGLHKFIRATRKAHGPFAVVVAADWNLDFHKAWVRAFIRAHFPSLKLSWHDMPAGGDEGKRLISASLYSRQLTTAGSRLGRHLKPFDHARFTTAYTFRDAHKGKRKP